MLYLLSYIWFMFYYNHYRTSWVFNMAKKVSKEDDSLHVTNNVDYDVTSITLIYSGMKRSWSMKC